MKNEFQDLKLSTSLLKVLEEMGFNTMTPIQSAALPELLKGQDLIGQAKTGSGKTATFVLPILQKIDVVDVRPQALILCPTRELCDQVIREVRKFAKNMPQLRTVALIGGQSSLPQEAALLEGVHFVVGTPGRTLEFLRNKKFQATRVSTLVLDEADRLLETGFAEDLQAIRDHLPEKRQTIFFSATFSEKFDRTWLKPDAKTIKIEDAPEDRPKITSYLYEAEKPEKLAILLAILQKHPAESALIFCRTKASVNEIGAQLIQSGASAAILHSDLNQSERDRSTAMFRNGSIRILVATDVAARGIDVDTLSLVVNFDLPPTLDVFVHRIGRTGRAGRSGTAVSIATDYEKPFVSEIEKTMGQSFARETLDLTPVAPSWSKSQMRTIQMAGGQTQGVSEAAVALALTSEPNKLAPNEIGKIILYDRVTYLGVNEASAESALSKILAATFNDQTFRARIL